MFGHLNFLVVVVLLQLLLLPAPSLASGETLSMTIHQAGFHRVLRYDTYFLQPWQPEPCAVCLEQEIPAGAYVDTDQLDDLQRMGKIEYYTSSAVNVEAMSSESEPFTLFLYGSSGGMNTIQMPVHFRYHPAGDQSFVRVTIPPPQMFMNCSYNERLPSARHLSASAAQHQAHDLDSQKSEVLLLPCQSPSRSPQMCTWRRVDYDLHSDPIVVSLPIGSRSVESLVVFVSIAVAWAACYYISLAVYNKASELETAAAAKAK